MTESADFITELLLEAEAKESQNLYAFNDMVIGEITELENQIASNECLAEDEIGLIRGWLLEKNSKLNEKIDFLKMKLEAFIRQEQKKTISLPRGTLKLHKKPDRVEVTNQELFLTRATKEMITIIPETVKPNLQGIKNFIKMSGRVPDGVEAIEGVEEFSLTINKKEK